MKLLLGISGAFSIIAMLVGGFSHDTFVLEKPEPNSILISKTGSGKGIIRVVPEGICDLQCNNSKFSIAEGSVIKLIAEPHSNSDFQGWSGACRGESRECIVIVGTNSQIAANFLSR
jgi:hypothetical protein